MTSTLVPTPTRTVPEPPRPGGLHVLVGLSDATPPVPMPTRTWACHPIEPARPLHDLASPRSRTNFTIGNLAPVTSRQRTICATTLCHAERVPLASLPHPRRVPAHSSPRPDRVPHPARSLVATPRQTNPPSPRNEPEPVATATLAPTVPAPNELHNRQFVFRNPRSTRHLRHNTLRRRRVPGASPRHAWPSPTHPSGVSGASSAGRRTHSRGGPTDGPALSFLAARR